MNNFIAEDAKSGDIAAAFNVSRESLEKLRKYVDLLGKWQASINLIGPREYKKIWSRHIADGLQVFDLLPKEVGEIADLGSGAGIPGIILAIVGQECGWKVHLVESNGKKAAFLREVIRELKLPANVHCTRVEALEGKWLGEVNLITARALAPVNDLIELSAVFKKNDVEMLFLKGLNVDIELTNATKYWIIQHELLPSRTHADGSILRIKDVQRVENF